MRLYSNPYSYNARRALAVAYQLEIPIEVVVVDLMSGAQRAQSFLDVNPNGRVPTLVDGDFTLWESTAIMQYLASQRPNPLWPDSVRTRADIARWQAWDLAHFGRAADVFLFENLLRKLFNMGEPNAVALADADRGFRAHAAVLEAHIKGRSFVVGDGPTLADFSLAGPVSTAPNTGLPLGDFPNIRAWYDRVIALPGWARTLAG